MNYMYQITKRLLPGQDVRDEIEKLIKEHEISAGVIVSSVGSLTKLCLRVADGKTVREWEKPLEIVSCTGTLSQAGCHIHISASDQEGLTVGGHLKQGCVVGTTVELVMLVFNDVHYNRVPDSLTGYEELEVK